MHPHKRVLDGHHVPEKSSCSLMEQCPGHWPRRALWHPMRQPVPSPQDRLRRMELSCPISSFDYRNEIDCNSETSPSIDRALSFHASLWPAKKMIQMLRDCLTNSFGNGHQMDGLIIYTDDCSIIRVWLDAFSLLVRHAMMDRELTARSYLLYHASKSEKLSRYAPGSNLGSILSRSSLCVTPVKTSKVPPRPHSIPN